MRRAWYMALLLPLAIGARADDAPQRDPASDDIARLSALCQASPEDWEARLRLANAFLAAHRASEADAAYLKVLAARPSNATALLGRAQAAEARGRWVDASRLYRQAVEAGSGSDTRRAWLGLLHSLTRADPSRSSESARELHAAFETALALPEDEQDPVIWELAATQALRDSQPSIAVQRSQELIRRFPGSPWGPSSLGWSLRVQGKDKEADAAYARITKLQPATDFAAQVTKLRLPFTGRWEVVQGPGGSYSHRGVRNRFAWDFRALDDEGRTRRGDGRGNSDYPSFGAPILAAADGWVVDLRDGAEDEPPGIANRLKSGNSVVIEHAPAEFTAYHHLQKHSICVKLGQRVKAGDKIAACGNSGFSTGPHVHFVLCTGRPPNDVARPAVFERYVRTRRGERFVVADGCPDDGQWVEPPQD